MNKFFTSDTHFGHGNILKYTERPFKGIKEHDEGLIKNWNSVIKPGDDVYHAGDVAFKMNKDMGYIKSVLQRLNGNIHVAAGNHDHRAFRKLMRALGWDVEYMHYIRVKDEEIDGGVQEIVVCHYPMLSWRSSHRGSWQLFGHHHGSTSSKGMNVYKLITPNQLDVGVDTNNFTPVSYERVKEVITKQNLGTS